MNTWFKKEDRFPCPPNMQEIRKNMSEYIGKYIHAEKEEIRDAENMILCVEDYLNQYNMFTTGNPPEENLINEIYNKTLKMLDAAEESRKYQEQMVRNKLEYYKEEFTDACNNRAEGSYCEDVWFGICAGDDLLESFDYDFKALKRIKSYCKSANNNSKKTICVEKFVNFEHERGPYIPLGCGGYLPELLSEELEGEPESLMERMTSEIEDETQRVLDCLKDYKG